MKLNSGCSLARTMGRWVVATLGFLLMGFSTATTTFADTWEAYRDASWKTDGVTLTIKTAGQLAQFAYLTNRNLFPCDKRIQLAADIDLSAHDWIPINNTSGWCPYYGVIFDGNGHTIKGLRCNGTSLKVENVGLFGSLCTGNPRGDNISDSEYNKLCDDYIKRGWVYNLTIDGAIVEGGKYTGVLAGSIDGNGDLISNITIKNSTVTGIGGAGGIAGFTLYMAATKLKVINTIVTGKTAGGALGNIDNLSDILADNVTVIGSEYAGGIVAEGIFIKNAQVSGKIEAPTVGGIAGASESIEQCVNLAEVHSTGKYGGGIVGAWRGGNVGGIVTCCNRGVIRMSNGAAGGVGGLVGVGGGGGMYPRFNRGIINCMNSGNIYVNSSTDVAAGGLIGDSTLKTGIRKSYSRGVIVNNGSSGGLVGRSLKSDGALVAMLTYCFWWNGSATSAGSIWDFGPFNRQTVSSFGSAPGLLADRISGWVCNTIGGKAYSTSTTDLLVALTMDRDEYDAGWSGAWTLNNSPDGYPMLTSLADTIGGKTWKPGKYVVYFDGKEGNTPAGKSVTYGSAYGTLPTTSRIGFTFVGWYTDSHGGVQVTAGTIVNQESNHTLYARWSPKTFTVTCDAASGTPAKQTVSVTYGETYTLPAAPVRAGFSFMGWFTAKTGGTKVTSESTVAITAGQTLYAQWVVYVNTYNISFDAQGGTVAASTKEVMQSYSYGTLPVPSRTDYAFLGWYTGVNGTGTRVSSGTTVTQSSSHTLYAKWIYGVIPVTFNGNGGEPADQSESQMYGSWYNLPPAPVREGYTFLGWFTNSGGSGVPITSSASVTETTAFYAKWVAAGALPTVYVIADGPGTITVSPLNGQVVNGKAVTLTAKPNKDALFVDWDNGEATAAIKVVPGVDTVYVARFRLKTDCADPEIDYVTDAENQMVGVPFEMQVEINDDAKPVKFTATGLPAGVKINAATGLISGVPTKAGTFGAASVKVTSVANSKKVATIALPPITIEALPWNAQGTFNGVILDENFDGWGLLTATVSSAGKITAKVVSTNGTWSFTAPSWSDRQDEYFMAAMQTAKGQTLQLTLDVEQPWNSAFQMSGEINGTAYYTDAQRNPFLNAKEESFAAASAALADFAGNYYTFALSGVEIDGSLGEAENIPEGDGYLTVTVAAKGAVKYSGKLADGTAVSGSTTLQLMDGVGMMPCFVPLYSAKGAFVGAIGVSTNGMNDVTAFNWYYPGKTPTGKTPATEDRFAMSLFADGGLYDKTVNLADYYAGKGFSADECFVELESDGKGGIKIPKGKAPFYNREYEDYEFDEYNPNVLTLTLNKATGLFTGKFNVYDIDYDTATPKLKATSIACQGVLLHEPSSNGDSGDSCEGDDCSPIEGGETPPPVPTPASGYGRGFYLLPETWLSYDDKPVSYPIKRSYPVSIY